MADLSVARGRVWRGGAAALFLAAVPFLLGFSMLKLWHYDLSLPFRYASDADAIWQLILSKALFDTGWVLDIPALGAPDIAHWHGNASAQTSALHSVLMLAIRPFVSDAVTMQQVYYVLNFPLIAGTSYVAARLIGVRSWTTCCIGLLYAFTHWRLGAIFYSYLGNYFVIPLSVVPPVWTLAGRLAGPLRTVLRSGPFWISLAFVVITAVTDGYFAFFTLLLIGFAAAVRALADLDLRRLVAPGLLAVALMGTAYTLAWPLRSYEQSHPAEFMVDGKVDSSLIKHTYEAEIYSSTLKLMVAPIPNHRVALLDRLGTWMVDTSKPARTFPGGAGVSLGTLGSLCLIGAMALLMARVVTLRPLPAVLGGRSQAFGAILALILFAFLCTTFGGIGSLVALIYPTIRAYFRLSLFTIFLGYVGAGLLIDVAVERLRGGWRVLGWGASLALVALGILDQIPRDFAWRDPSALTQYPAERRFIRAIEASVPEGTEIYQYPYSNYLFNSPYYGWGAFKHVRFYMHSRHLRWSTGAFKNTPVDQWHMWLAGLPPEQIVTEARAAGFGGFLVDRTVVGDAEYERVRDAVVARTGVQPVVDEASKLAFWRLPSPGYRLDYDTDYQQAARVVVTDKQAIAPDALSRMIDPEGFAAAVRSAPETPAMISRADHPEAFADPRQADAGLGLIPIQPFSALRADVLCPGVAPMTPADTLTMTVRDRSAFDLRLNSGPVPIRVGLKQVLGADGAQLRWDYGYRVAGSPTIKRGDSVELSVPLSGADLRTGVPAGMTEITAVFGLVQDGVAWLGPNVGNAECRVRLRL